jgi:hypothetical protein
VAAAYYHNGYMEEALIEMEKGRSLHGLDVIEPIRIDALVALFSGNSAPARARLEEVSRLSSQAIGDTYLALAYYYSGSIERGRTMLESLAESRSASTAARAGAALGGVLAAQGEICGRPPARRARVGAQRSRSPRRVQPRRRLREGRRCECRRLIQTKQPGHQWVPTVENLVQHISLSPQTKALIPHEIYFRADWDRTAFVSDRPTSIAG